VSLTAKKVRDAKPSDKTKIVWDGEVKGLGLRITKAGVKAFVLSYRSGGTKRLVTLGRTSEISLNDARDLAGDNLVAIRQGADPLRDRAARMAEPTVRDGAERFTNDYIPNRKAKGRMSATTEREYNRQLEKYILPKIGQRKIKDMSKRDVELLLKPLPPVMANRVCALVSSLFTQFEHWEYRPQHTNPARGIERAVEEERDRTLTETELKALGQALTELDGANPCAILAIRLAAVTGLRIGEIRNMRWADVNFESGALTLPKTKTGRRIHTMPSAALALLADGKRPGDCVISGRDPNNPLDYRSIQRHFAKACRAAGIENARIHDLRRTIMTEAASLGVGAHLLRDFVGHKTTAMAERYARQAGAPLTELRERMGESFGALISGATPDTKTKKRA